jgi:hypothetical protein
MCEPFLIAGLQLEKSLREAHAKPAVRPVYNGAEGETRTLTPLRILDFESSASTNS